MIRKQTMLLQKARNSLAAARLLAGEGHLGFAASRPYYTMFYLAEALLLEKNLAFSKHSAVNAAFGQHFAKTGILPPELHRYRLDAEDVRIIGDYDDEELISIEKVESLFVQASEFLEVAERRLGDQPSTTEQPGSSPP